MSSFFVVMKGVIGDEGHETDTQSLSPFLTPHVLEVWMPRERNVCRLFLLPLRAVLMIHSDTPTLHHVLTLNLMMERPPCGAHPFSITYAYFVVRPDCFES